MITSMLCGLTGFVFIHLLCQPFEAFGWWPPMLRKFLFGSVAIVEYEEMVWWELLIYKPLAACGKCFAGWFSALFYLSEYGLDFSLIFFASGAIFTAWSLEQLKNKIEQ